MKLSFEEIFNFSREYVKLLLELNNVNFDTRENNIINYIYRENRYKATILFFKAGILNFDIDEETVLSRSFKENYFNTSMSQKFDLLATTGKRNEDKYKNKTIEEFGDRLLDTNSKADFDTWEEFYNYVNYMINTRVNIFSLRNLDFSILKNGDLVENTNESGNRMDGVFIVNNEKLEELIDYPDDYGTIPEKFKVISEFPVSYWHDSYNNLNKFESYWHNSYVWFDPTEIGLKIYKKDFKKLNYKFTSEWYDKEQENTSYYYIFSYKNIKYCIIIEDSEIINEKFDLNKSKAYSVIDGDMVDLPEELKTLLQDKGIYKEQILIKDL